MRFTVILVVLLAIMPQMKSQRCYKATWDRCSKTQPGMITQIIQPFRKPGCPNFRSNTLIFQAFDCVRRFMRRSKACTVLIVDDLRPCGVGSELYVQNKTTTCHTMSDRNEQTTNKVACNKKVIPVWVMRQRQAIIIERKLRKLRRQGGCVYKRSRCIEQTMTWTLIRGKAICDPQFSGACFISKQKTGGRRISSTSFQTTATPKCAVVTWEACSSTIEGKITQSITVDTSNPSCVDMNAESNTVKCMTTMTRGSRYSYVTIKRDYTPCGVGSKFYTVNKEQIFPGEPQRNKISSHQLPCNKSIQTRSGGAGTATPKIPILRNQKKALRRKLEALEQKGCTYRSTPCILWRMKWTFTGGDDTICDKTLFGPCLGRSKKRKNKRLSRRALLPFSP